MSERKLYKWNVCRYFDDHYECIMSSHKTKEDAEKARDLLSPGAYIRYHVREHIYKQ